MSIAVVTIAVVILGLIPVSLQAVVLILDRKVDNVIDDIKMTRANTRNLILLALASVVWITLAVTHIPTEADNATLIAAVTLSVLLAAEIIIIVVYINRYFGKARHSEGEIIRCAYMTLISAQLNDLLTACVIIAAASCGLLIALSIPSLIPENLFG